MKASGVQTAKSSDRSETFLCYPANREILDRPGGIPRPLSKNRYTVIILLFFLPLLAVLANTVLLYIVDPIRECFSSSIEQTFAACVFRIDYIFGSLISIALLLFFSYFIILGVHEMWQNHLFRKGQGILIDGSVIAAHVKHSRDDDGDSLVIHYMFTAPNRTIIKAKTRIFGRSANQSPPLPATPVAILYVNPLVYRIL
jgi:hypothetical protein